MWEKISKEMQLPWRAAEAMHWQIGEGEMAQRANVPVFHLAGQQAVQAGMMAQRVPSISPPSSNGPHSVMSYSHTHNHSLPYAAMPQPQPVSPVHTRLQSSSTGSPNEPPPLRRRADSVRSVPTASPTNRTILPPMGELTGSAAPTRYTLPPVVTSSDGSRR